ncbi:uncharacterized [Tachysurus ichikawai]
MYEANIYRIPSTGIDKAAFDEMPLCSKHVPVRRPKRKKTHKLNKQLILCWAPTDSQGTGQAGWRKEAMRRFRSL